MSRARGALCRACLALAAALAALLLLPLPLPRVPAPAPAPARAPSPSPGRRASPARPASVPRLRPEDVFIAVKTTQKNHGPRLGLLLSTWISRARQQVGLAPGSPISAPLTPRPGTPIPRAHSQDPVPRSQPSAPPTPLSPQGLPRRSHRRDPRPLLCPQSDGQTLTLSLWGPMPPSHLGGFSQLTLFQGRTDVR